jgi:hypothetical protein
MKNSVFTYLGYQREKYAGGSLGCIIHVMRGGKMPGYDAPREPKRDEESGS